jgi:inorganic pyrophosphatase
MTSWRTTPAGPDPPELVYGIVETPQRTRTKYEVAKSFEGVILDRILHGSLHYPANYGLLPRSWAEDGDPLDVLVLTTEPTHPGCVVRARPIGVLDMVDEGEADHKVLAALDDDPRQEAVEELEDVADQQLREIEEFFDDYKKLELGSDAVETRGWEGRGTAYRIIEDSYDRYRRKWETE